MKKEKLKIIYEDEYLIVVDKKAGLLTVGTEKEKEDTLFHKLLEFQKQKNKNNKIFIVHRLDKDTSGLVVFAKNEKTKKLMQDNWEFVERKYLTIVSGLVNKDNGTIESYLKETKTFLVYSTNDQKYGKYARTDYKVLNRTNNSSVLEIDIKTGRKNQIRVHLNDIGHPILGDKKYNGRKHDLLKRLCLHAYYLSFVHPVTNKKIIISTDVPKQFNLYMQKPSRNN